jgi:hypothetical protein
MVFVSPFQGLSILRIATQRSRAGLNNFAPAALEFVLIVHFQ